MNRPANVSPGSSPTERRFLSWVGPLWLLAVLAAMASWSWGYFGHMIVDFGREVYVPWRLVDGDVLYRDLAYFNGPLSPYWNAAVFQVLGVSLRSLALANLLVIALTTLVIYRLFRYLASELAAVVCGTLFLTLFAFRQFEGIGNYSFLTPYSHEMTHGALLAFSALLSFAAVPKWGRKALWVSGFLLGCLFLTKIETFFPTAVGLGVGLFWMRRAGLRVSLLEFLVAASIAPLLAWILLGVAIGAGPALLGTLGAWTVFWQSDLRELTFYQSILGTDASGENLLQMLTGSLIALTLWAVAFGVPALLRRHLTAKTAWRTLAGVGFVAATVSLYLWVSPATWVRVVQPAPLILLALIGWQIQRFRTKTPTAQDASRLALSIVALLFTFKMALNLRVEHYGFVLALPATLVLVAAALNWPQKEVREGAVQSRRILGPQVLWTRALVLAPLVAAALSLLQVTADRYSRRVHPLCEEGDHFLAGPGAPLIEEVLRRTASTLQPDDTLAVFPEGVMLNYLLRTKNPTPYFSFMPPELLMFGEDHMLKALQATPPTYVALVHRPTRDYGLNWFGQDYGQALYQWLLNDYETLGLIGDPPLEDQSRVGVRVLRRK